MITEKPPKDLTKFCNIKLASKLLKGKNFKASGNVILENKNFRIFMTTHLHLPAPHCDEFLISIYPDDGSEPTWIRSPLSDWYYFLEKFGLVEQEAAE